MWPIFRIAAIVGISKYPKNSGFGSHTFNSCIWMSIIVLKCRFTGPIERPRISNVILTIMLINPMWLKFKMVAKIGTSKITQNSSFGRHFGFRLYWILDDKC